ncbi:VOC family protein [Chitinimonas naiadis]
MSQAASLAGLLRLNNLALAVGNLDAMVRWYQGVLGFALTETGRFDAVGADYAMLDGAGVRLELVSRPTAKPRPVDRTAPPGHLGILGWKALVLETDSLEPVNQQLRQHGVEVLWADQAISADRHSTMLRDPEGNLIHIFGPRR